MFCEKCGTEIGHDANFCPKCRYKINEKSFEQEPFEKKIKKLQRPVEWKSEAITIIISILWIGLGHIYIAQIKKGIIYVAIGLVFSILGFVEVLTLLLFFPIMIWVVYDAYKQCKFYNKTLEETGRKPEW